MFPFVYGFEWQPGYLIFLGVFFTVAIVVAATLITAGWRALRDLRRGREAEIRWQSLFHELPAADRICRHSLTGQLPGRTCDNGFACGHCEVHARLNTAAPPPEMAQTDVMGIPVFPGRYYHRGHTWVSPEPDGTLLIGLDEFSKRILGRAEHIELPAERSILRPHGLLAKIRKGASEFHVMTPVGGMVAGVGRPDGDWWVRVRPDPGTDLSHLLRGSEVSAWYLRELERLQLAISGVSGAASLADGGVLADDLSKVCPPPQWDAACGQILLDV
jgi:hypothetical protein